MSKKTIGIISDTHGLLRQEVIEHFRRCDLILHAGDIGDVEVLRQLEALAKVVAVRGNVDHGGLSRHLRNVERIDFAGLKIIIVHNRDDLATRPEKPGVDIVIYGHSHQPKIEYRDEVLFFNPGSAGPRRFRLPICIGTLTWAGKKVVPEIIHLDPEKQ